MWTWLIVIACVFALPIILPFVAMLVLGPLAVRRKQTMPIKSNYQETRAEDLTPEMRDFIANLLRDFVAAGFEVAANLHQDRPGQKLDSSQVLLVNRTTGDTATAIVVRAANRRSMSFLLRSRFADGTSLVTVSSKTPSLFPPDPMIDRANFSWVGRGAELLEAHRRRLGASGRGDEARVAPARGEERAYVIKQRDRELERFVQSGYMWRDEAKGVCRYTWKGAILGAWKLARPVAQLRNARRDRKARRLWKQLGMDSWRPQAAGGEAAAPAHPAPVPTTMGSDDPGRIGYEAVLPEGEMRGEMVGETLWIRLGRPSRSGAIVQQWGVLVSIAFWLLFIAFVTFNFWLSGSTSVFRAMSLPLALAAGCLSWDVLRIVRAVRMSNGTTVVSANHSGIRFRNAPSPRPDGEIARADISHIRVMSNRLSMRRRYWVEVRRNGSVRGQTILSLSNNAAMQEAARALREATGIESPRAVPPPLPV